MYNMLSPKRGKSLPQALKNTNDSPLGYRLFNIENAAKNKGQAYLKAKSISF